ncbi:MAG: hypothetical protein OXI50_06015, partial [Gammaproteobacteria bacterium]|nr:hypothetical protein [Gammaproteobacteria bacterium]
MRLSRVRGLLLVAAVVVAAVGVGLWASQGSASAQGPLPHETDSVDEPILEFVGEIPAETMGRFRSDFERMLAFFRDRFGDVPTDYTLFVAADARSGAAAVGDTYRNDFCNEGDLHYRLLVSDCHAFLPEHIAAYHFWAIKRLLAPRTVWPAASATYGPWGPEWLRDGLDEYVRVAYRAVAEIEPFERARRWKAALARLTPRTLSSIESCSAGSEVPCVAVSGLGFLGVEWLVARAGEQAIVEYYRLLPISRTWREAFEGAFEITIDEFYEEFEAQRRVITGAPPPSTITAQLQPGWNLIGWMGSDTTTGEIFGAIPELRVVAAWDEDTERYIWARRGGAVPPELEQLTRGQALFLWVGGTEPVQWARPASAEGMLLTLPPGYSLVGWAGLDGTPIADAVGRFGAALTGVSTWNADTQSYERYTPGAKDPAQGTAVLNHGDALWVELSQEARWWQSGTRRTEFTFAAKVTQERESELREEMDRVVAFFAERYGIEPPPFSVLVDPNLEVAGSASPGLIRIGQGLPFAHEYFHVVQYHLSELSPGAGNSPPWMTEGSATYAAAWYWRERAGASDANFRWASWRSFAEIIAPLRTLEHHEVFRDTGVSGYNLGAFAVDWLVKRAAGLPADFSFAEWESGGLDGQTKYDSYVQYYRLLASAQNWQEALEGAFGIRVDDFYTEFEEHRSQVTAQVPHLSDDRDEPVLVLLGEFPTDVAARVRGEFDELQAFLRDRLGTGPADYTVWVAADGESAASARLVLLGEEPRLGSRYCAGVDAAIGAYVALHCYDRLPGHLATTHFHSVRERLAPWRSLPSVPMGYERWGPHWLQAAAIAYMAHASATAVGADPLDRVRRRQAIIAAATKLRLDSMETQTGMASVPEHSGEALSFLAADLLVERAGERSLFEYYRLLPSSGSWQRAFEQA